MLQLKNLCGRSAVEEVTTWDEKILKELEGLSGGKAWFAGTLLVQGPDRSGQIGISDRLHSLAKSGQGRTSKG